MCSPTLAEAAHWARGTPCATALTSCLASLARATAAHRLPELGAALGAAAHWKVPLEPASLRAGLQSLCSALAVSYFPRYGPLFLHACMDALSRAAPPRMHTAVLNILAATFTAMKAHDAPERPAPTGRCEVTQTLTQSAKLIVVTGLLIALWSVSVTVHQQNHSFALGCLHLAVAVRCCAHLWTDCTIQRTRPGTVSLLSMAGLCW
jgi:hypothetical protein